MNRKKVTPGVQVMIRSEAQLVTLTAALYEAATDSSLYPAFIASLSSHVGSSMAFMHHTVKQDNLNWYDSTRLGLNAPGETFSVRANHSLEDQLVYTNDWVLQDGFTSEVIARGLAKGLLAFDRREVCADDTFEHSPFYHEFARAHEFFHVVGGTGFSADRQTGFYLMFGRPKSLGPFDEQAVASLSLLLPHVLRAQAVHLKWWHLRQEQRTRTFALEALGRACLVVDVSGKVSWLSAAAEALLSRNDGLSLRSGQLCISTPKQHQLLREAVRRCVAIGKDASGRAGDTLLVARTPPATPLLMSVLPIPGSETPDVLLILDDPEQQRAVPAKVLRNLYGLTTAEARVALLLAEGYAVEDIAARLQVKLGTVRNQLKQVFSKTATHRQGQLVRLVLSVT